MVKQNTLLLSLVSFINDISSKMILPILPLFIVSLGGSGVAIGLISGIGESLSAILKVISGFYSDKINKRKPFVFWGYFISSFSKLILYVSNTWWFVLIFRSTERIGKGLRSAPRDAMLAKSKQTGRTFGFHRMFDSAGSVVGTLITLFLVFYLSYSYKEVIFIAGIVAFVSLIPIFFTKDEGKVKNETLKFSFSLLSKDLKKFIIVATIFALANFSYMFFILKVSNFDLWIPVMLYAVFNVSYTMLAYTSGLLADRIGKKSVLMMGYSLFAILTIAITLVESLFMYILFFILYGVVFAFINSNERAYVSDLSKHKGTGLGVYYTFTSIAALPAGLIAGYLFDINPNFTFIYGACLSLLALVIFYVE